MKCDKLILQELRRQGFKRMYRSRGGGAEVISYEKTVGPRRLDIQLWEDGRHRVSHYLNDRMCTTPTNFSSAAEMCTAIQHELTRTDHPAVYHGKA